jgi:hypothetical protein
MASNWQEKFPSFEVLSGWSKTPIIKLRRKSNEYRIIEIDATLFLEVKAMNSELTFLTDLKHFNLIKNYTWISHKIRNIYYVETVFKKEIQKFIQFYKMIHPEWSIIDHISRMGLDNKNCNLRKTSKKENALNVNYIKQILQIIMELV